MSEVTSSEGAAGRRRRIVEIVESRGFCTIAELAVILGVSEMTVRRDVSRLESSGLVNSFHGGVRAPGGQNFLGTDYAARTEMSRDVKLLLAQSAAQMARSLSVIAIDSGTTAAAMADLLDDEKRLRVITASLPVLTALNTHRNVEVTALGGVLHVESQSFLGFSTAEAAREVNVEAFFITASAASDRGLFCTYELAAGIKRALIEVAERVILVTDSTKFATGAMTRICGWDKIDILLTDDQLDREIEDAISAQGVEVIRVPTGVALPVDTTVVSDGH